MDVNKHKKLHKNYTWTQIKVKEHRFYCRST